MMKRVDSFPNNLFSLEHKGCIGNLGAPSAKGRLAKKKSCIQKRNYECLEK